MSSTTSSPWVNPPSAGGGAARSRRYGRPGSPEPIEALGVMLPRAGMPLTDEQVEAVAAYAYMLSRM